MFKITRLTLDGIGPFDHAEIELGEGTRDGGGSLVLFEGPNGSGKTTIAHVIALLVAASIQLARRFSQPAVVMSPDAPISELLRRFRGRPAQFEAWSGFGDREFKLSVTPEGDQAFKIKHFSQIPPDGQWISLWGSTNDAIQPVRHFAFTARGHQPTPIVATPGPTELVTPHLDGALSFGANSAASYFGQFLTNLESDRVRAKVYAAERPEGPERDELTQRAASLGRTLARFELALSKLTQRDVKITFPITQQAPRVTFDRDEIPLDLLGEGLRSSVSWLADLLVRLERHPWPTLDRAPFEQPFVMILDEVDEGLHPSLQMVLLPTLRELFPNADVFATTHSPFVVASAAEGVVIPLRPDAQHRITGKIQGIPLRPGQTLSWVTEEVFGVPSGFIDEASRAALDTHRAAIQTLRAGGEPDWDAFRRARDVLLSLNEETRSIVSYRELPVREKVQRGLAA